MRVLFRFSWYVYDLPAETSSFQIQLQTALDDDNSIIVLREHSPVFGKCVCAIEQKNGMKSQNAPKNSGSFPLKFERKSAWLIKKKSVLIALRVVNDRFGAHPLHSLSKSCENILDDVSRFHTHFTQFTNSIHLCDSQHMCEPFFSRFFFHKIFNKLWKKVS